MSGTSSAISSALGALHVYSRRVDQAAARIATAGLDLESPDSANPSAGPAAATASAPAADLADLSTAMTSMMIAQRAFSAQLRVLRTADEMLQDTVNTVR